MDLTTMLGLIKVLLGRMVDKHPVKEVKVIGMVAIIILKNKGEEEVVVNKQMETINHPILLTSKIRPSVTLRPLLTPNPLRLLPAPLASSRQLEVPTSRVTSRIIPLLPELMLPINGVTTNGSLARMKTPRRSPLLLSRTRPTRPSLSSSIKKKPLGKIRE